MLWHAVSLRPSCALTYADEQPYDADGQDVR